MKSQNQFFTLAQKHEMIVESISKCLSANKLGLTVDNPQKGITDLTFKGQQDLVVEAISKCGILIIANEVETQMSTQYLYRDRSLSLTRKSETELTAHIRLINPIAFDMKEIGESVNAYSSFASAMPVFFVKFDHSEFNDDWICNTDVYVDAKEKEREFLRFHSDFDGGCVEWLCKVKGGKDECPGDGSIFVFLNENDEPKDCEFIGDFGEPESQDYTAYQCDEPFRFEEKV